jgi:hypothetical protein
MSSSPALSIPLALIPGVGLIELVLILMTLVLVAWPACRICRRAGFPAAMGLLSLLPVANLILLLVLAFADWPALAGKPASPSRFDEF